MEEVFIPIGAFLMVFAIVYVVVTARNRERMALIEKGADPKLFENLKGSAASRALRWGLLLVGVGVGIFLASLLVEAGLNETASYFAMISLFGGAGLLVAYRIEQKSNASNKAE